MSSQNVFQNYLKMPNFIWNLISLQVNEYSWLFCTLHFQVSKHSESHRFRLRTSHILKFSKGKFSGPLHTMSCTLPPPALASSQVNPWIHALDMLFVFLQVHCNKFKIIKKNSLSSYNPKPFFVTTL